MVMPARQIVHGVVSLEECSLRDLADVLVLDQVVDVRSVATSGDQPRQAEFGEVLRDGSRTGTDVLGEAVHRVLTVEQCPDDPKPGRIGEQLEQIDGDRDLGVVGIYSLHSNAYSSALWLWHAGAGRRRGDQVTRVMQIISLVPSVTETLIAWQRPPMACTRFCEQPDLLHVGGTKDPDIDRIVELEPDLVIVDAEENRREDYDALVSQGIRVHVLHVRSLADVDPTMQRLAHRIEAEWVPTTYGRGPEPVRLRAFVPIWRRPWMALGTPTYGASLLALLGVATVFADDGPYPTVLLDDVMARHPDVVLAPSEPYPFTARQLPELSSVAPTVFVDGKDLFWWGTRTAGAVQRLAGVLAEVAPAERPT